MAQAPRTQLLAGANPEVLTDQALSLVATLQRTYGHARQVLLARRSERLASLRSGALLTSDDRTSDIRDGDWQVPAPAPHLTDRRCEITGPADAKMMISALNSGARVFMCDLEDALSPTWSNIVTGHRNIRDAAVGALCHDRGDGRVDTVGPDQATLVVRPRGLHLPEPRVLVDGTPVAAAVFDLAVVASLAGPAYEAAGTPLALYLPKIESWHEAAWWDALIGDVERRVGLAPRSIRVTVLIETITAAVQMDEILFALRERAAGLNAGRWDYLFSMVKNVGHSSTHLLPDRSALTMDVPFLAAYAERLVEVCHRRGAYAIGGMAPFVPNKADPQATENAFEQTRTDKRREADLGYDGTWVAHPGLVSVATEVFDAAFGPATNQLDVRPAVTPGIDRLLDTAVPGAAVTALGLEQNISAALRYVVAWLDGRGAVALDGKMEDVATAEIARCQIWQWIHHGARDDEGGLITRHRVDDRLTALAAMNGTPSAVAAAEVVRAAALADELPDFLTLLALDRLG